MNNKDVEPKPLDDEKDKPNVPCRVAPAIVQVIDGVECDGSGFDKDGKEHNYG